VPTLAPAINTGLTARVIPVNTARQPSTLFTNKPVPPMFTNKPVPPNTVLVLVDSFYKAKSSKGDLLGRVHAETPWKLDVVKLPGHGLRRMRDELKAQEGHLHIYEGVLVVSMGNDLIDNNWNNISEIQFPGCQPALQTAISDMATLLHPLNHHYVIYGGSGKCWWSSHPSQPLGETFDRRRDWVVNSFKDEGVHADTGEREFTQAAYTVDDVYRLHHRVSGAEKAVSVLLQWVAEAVCG